MWSSPSDQPGWARPALLVITALAVLSYTWHTGTTIELYYSAAVRSMSMSWHDFFYGAFDPAGTVTVDKLPGAFWIQALAVRAFGFHDWAILLPQAVAGGITVLVLFHAVRRVAGPGAGAVAALVLAASPATVTLDRGNIPDSFMILFLVLAADSTVTVLIGGRWRSAVMVGVWVGLAFQTKMLEAWLVLPAFAFTYLLAGREGGMARLGRAAVMGAVTVVVSLAWMTFVTLAPTADRPYTDGSTNDSVYHQVFVYNGLSRVGQPSPNAELGKTLGTPLFTQAEPPPTWDRLLTGSYGHDTGWLLPLAVLAVAGALALRRRQDRTDLPRAGIVLWGLWLLVLAVVFTVSTTMNSYYAGALSPAVAGVLGIATALAWQHRREPAVLWFVAALVLVATGFAAWLLPSAGTGLPAPLVPVLVVLGVASAGVLAVSAWRPGAAAGPGPSSGLALLAAGVAVLVVPAVASASVVTEALGPFDTPFQPTAVTNFIHRTFAPQPDPPGLALLESARRGAPYLMAAQTSALASGFIYATGQEVVPLGGYTGTTPEPSLSSLESMVSQGLFHVVLVTDPGASPASKWVASHCLPVKRVSTGSAPLPVSRVRVYFCRPLSVSGAGG